MHSKKKYSAQEYASLFQQGDEQALAFFYLEFHAALAFHAFGWVKNRALAEEIASDAFIKIWKQHWKLDNYFAIRAYLYKTVQRDSQRWMRKEIKRRTTDINAVVATVTNDTPFDHMVRSEVHRLIHSALKDLSPGSRRVLTMHYLEGKSTVEIATELQLSPSTIKTQKTRGLDALRKQLLRPMMFPLFFMVKIFLDLL